MNNFCMPCLHICIFDLHILYLSAKPHKWINRSILNRVDTIFTFSNKTPISGELLIKILISFAAKTVYNTLEKSLIKLKQNTSCLFKKISYLDL